MNVRALTLLAALVVSAPFAAAASDWISGQVVDAVTGNPVPDVNVVVDGVAKVGGATNLAGQFILRGLTEGESYILHFSHVSYESAQIKAVAGGQHPLVKLAPSDYQLAEVVVTSGRAEVGAVTNISQDEVQRANGVGEPPLLAFKVPNATYFNWGGLTVGATHLRLRGFDTNRLSVSVNGIPINDPEDHNVYWQDIPDFLSNTHDVQVQRGVSALGAGPAGVGGGLNLETSDAVAQRETALSIQSGNYNTRRHTFLYRSGLVEGRYNVTGRFSRIVSDGYRDHSGGDEWSYLLAATRYDSRLITTLQTFGGVEDTDLNFTAIPKSVMDTNRTYNPSANYGLNYDGERDHFSQPHYVLRNTWRASPTLTMRHNLFWIKGDGYYEQFKAHRRFAEYNLTPFDRYFDQDGDGDIDTVRISRTDLIRRKYVEKDQIGWMPSAELSLDGGGRVNAGLELRRYKSVHYGRVMWARELSAGVNPQHEWYRWRSRKLYTGAWGQWTHPMGEQFDLSLGLEVRRIGYEVEQDVLGAFKGYEYDVDWTFVNPRLSLLFKPQRDVDVYLTVARAGREPIDEQLLNADNPYDVPKLPKFGYKEVNPEQMTDIEAGIRHRMGAFDAGAGVYAMFFSDEIVYSGAYDADLDELAVTNAPTSRHLGIELTFAWRTPVTGLKLDGDLSLDKSIFGDFTYHYVYGYDDDYNELFQDLNLKGNQIPLTPRLVLNYRASYQLGGFTGDLGAHYTGRQYLDGREDKAASLEPFLLLNGRLGWSLPEIRGLAAVELEFRVMNLLDEEYESYGWVEVGEPMFIPAAGRFWLAGVNLRL